MSEQSSSHALKIKRTALEHTYVVVTDSNKEIIGRYPCNGRNKGGRTLGASSGAAHHKKTDIIDKEGRVLRFTYRKKNYKVKFPTEAGVLYSANGVCHTMANRILYESRKTVHEAGGYNLSHALYGTYGLEMLFPAVAAIAEKCHIMKPYPGLTKAINKGLVAMWKEILREAGLSKLAAHTKAGTLSEQIAELYQHNLEQLDRDPESLHDTAFELLIKHRLGAGVDNNTVKQLLDLRRQLSRIKEDETAVTDASPEAIARQANQMANDFARACHKILDDQTYERLFGGAPNQDMEVVEPEKVKEAFEGIEVSVEDVDQDR